jgi:hypothetical protein
MVAMRRSTPLAPLATAALTVVVVAVLAACGGGGDDAGPSTTSGTTAPVATTVAAPPTTSGPPPTGLLPGESGGDPTYPEATEPSLAPVVTSPQIATTTSGVPAVSSAPATTEPVAVQELVLLGDGVGAAKLGTDPEGVIQYVTSILGGNTADTGWVAPDTFGFCPGNEARRVDWGVLSLLFSDASDLATGRRHFIGYEYGRIGEIGDEPAGLRTAGGVTLGSRVVDLLAEFPDATVREGDPELELPATFYVSDSFGGWLSGVGPDDFVTVIFGGFRCGG